MPTTKSSLPSWLSVLQFLRRLQSDSPVTLQTFRAAKGEQLWHWAVRQRGPDGPTGPHPGPSPWIAFVAGQTAGNVARLLPLILAERRLPVIAANEAAHSAIRDPAIRRRYQLAGALAEALSAHPEDWAWRAELLDQLNPDPFADTNADPWADACVRGDTAPRQRNQPPNSAFARPVPPPNPHEQASPPGSTRPVLRRFRDGKY
jgi:hypothetical protein